MVLGLKPRVLHMLGKCSNTDPPSAQHGLSLEQCHCPCAVTPHLMSHEYITVWSPGLASAVFFVKVVCVVGAAAP